MLQVVDEWFSGLEKLAWEMRHLSDQLVEEVTRAGGDARTWRERASRLASTGWMLTRVVTDYRLFGIYSAFLSKEKAAARLHRIHAASAERFYRTSVEQMGAFLKIGQLLSARPDLLPSPWIERLAGLQDDAPAEPIEHVRAVIAAELGPVDDVFSTFDDAPLAAASIGQVHRAVTKDGFEVAVKVQRPDVAEKIEHDLALATHFLEAMRSALPPTDWSTVTTEVADAVRAELDYRAEARAMARAADIFDGAPGVIVPRPLTALSSARVLTTPLVRAEKITTALDRRDRAFATRVLGTLLEVYLRQILDAGLFQADPHPGNFLVTDAGELVLLDFGCTRVLDEEARRGYRALVRAFIVGDGSQLTDLFERLGFRTQSGRPDTLLAFAAALLDAFRRGAVEGRLSWPTRDEILQQAAGLAEAAKRDPVTQLPGEFVLVARVFGTLAGLFQHYRPEIDYARLLPYLV